MPNHHIPIEEAGLWDILDWDCVVALASEATSNPNHNLKAAAALRLVNLAAKPGNEDVEFFHRLGKRWITSGTDAARRQQAGDLADMFGADATRLIDWVAFKWGWFKRINPPKPR
jgi:hypothetical protein